MREVTHLRDTLLDGITYRQPNASDDRGTFRVLHEVEINGGHYALMQRNDQAIGESFLYKVRADGQIGEIETVDEWEVVVDAIYQHLNTYDD
jgi:hypothetical protein